MLAFYKFATASEKAFAIGLSEFASYTEDGTQEYPVVFPFKLRLHPVYELPRETIDIDYREQLKTVPAGSTLYEVYAQGEPDGEQQLIGSIETDSEITPSKFGDEHLEFRHTRYEDDLAYRPDWTPYIASHDMYGFNEQMVCPFGILKNLLF